MHESLVKFSQIYETATPLELQELLPKFVEKITWKATEIEIALFNREEERGQSSTTPSNHSGGGALDVIKWLPREDSAIRPPEAASWPANFLSPRGLFLPSVGENWLRVLLTLQMKRPTDKLWAFSNWLPDYLTKRTIIASAKVRISVYLKFVRHQLVIITGKPPYGINPALRITRKLLIEAKPKVRKPSPIDEALKFANALREPSIVSRSQVAQMFGVSRIRVCQMLGLLELDEGILKYLTSIEDIDEHNYFTERKLRPIAVIKDREEQLMEFNRLKLEACREKALV